MDWITFFGLIFDLAGIIFLAIGFQIKKAPGILMSGSPAISLKYENRWYRYSGWFFIVIGQILQIIALFYL